MNTVGPRFQAHRKHSMRQDHLSSLAPYSLPQRKDRFRWPAPVCMPLFLFESENAHQNSLPCNCVSVVASMSMCCVVTWPGHAIQILCKAPYRTARRARRQGAGIGTDRPRRASHFVLCHIIFDNVIALRFGVMRCLQRQGVRQEISTFSL
jgi:hypothetical protein